MHVTVTTIEAIIPLSECVKFQQKTIYCKNVMELAGSTECNRMVNFKGLPEMIGQFIDVEITEVWAHSLRCTVVRTEQQIDLRVYESPHSVITLPRKENALGISIYQP
ncbi:MAG: TRAM domain-containing protein [Serratia symbiotica]|nr:TRAM domain-containing protein [Serratia symbiotica]